MAAPLRLGLIGAGRWGRNYIRTIASLDAVHLTGLASRNPETRSLVPPDCTVYGEWRDLLAAGALDAVIVATPPRLHAEMAIAAIEAGLPVLVEKPLTMDLAEATAVRDKAKQRAALVMVGHTHLFHPAYRALKTLAPGYGRMVRIDAEAGNFGPYRADIPVLWDWGAHDVAMCLDLVGTPPIRTAARTLDRKILEGGHGEVIELDLLFPDEVLARIRLGNMYSKRRRLAVYCEKGLLVYDDFAQAKLTVSERAGGGRSHEIAISADLPLTVLVREFAEASQSRTPGFEDVDLGLQVVEVLSQCEAQGRSS